MVVDETAGMCWRLAGPPLGAGQPFGQSTTGPGVFAHRQWDEVPGSAVGERCAVADSKSLGPAFPTKQ